MIRRDRELLAELARFNRQVPAFVLAYLDGQVSPQEQLAYAERLTVLAEVVRLHAVERQRLVVDGGCVDGELPTGGQPLVVRGSCVVVDDVARPMSDRQESDARRRTVVRVGDARGPGGVGGSVGLPGVLGVGR